MVAYHPRRYVSSWLIAKAMPPYETYAAPDGRRLTVWRAERRTSPAGSRLGRAPPHSVEHLLRAPPLSWRWSVPRAPRYPKPPRTRSAGRRSGPGPTRSPPPLPRGPPPVPPHANPLTPQVLPRDKEGVVRRLAVRPAASPFTPRTRPSRPWGRGYSCRGTRDQSKTSDPQYFLSLPV